jgi:hypothetical protein
MQNNDRTNVSGSNGLQGTSGSRDENRDLASGKGPASDVDRDKELTTSFPYTEAIPSHDAGSSSSSIPIRRLPATKRKPTNPALAQRSAPTLRFREKALLLVRRLSGRELMKLRYRKHVLRWRRAAGKKLSPGHWADIMGLLERLCQEAHVWPKSTKHRVMHVPEETVALLSGSTDLQENMWYVSIRNGCRIRVLDAAESEGPHRKVVLSGSERVIELVEKEIRRIQNLQADGNYEMKKPIVPIVPSVAALQQRGLPVPIIRAVWSERDSEPHSFSFPALPSPGTLSVNQFMQYVKDLVNCPLPPQKARDQQAKDDHRNKIASTIEKLFLREANQRFNSTSALNTALSFLCRNEFLRSARIVLSWSEAVASAETYNILLRSTARRQDQDFFRHILTSMSRFHVRPNGQTWIAFLECLISPGPKTHVMQRMMDLRYLEDRRTVEDAIQINIGSLLSPHLDSGQDIPSFIRFVEEEYAPGLLSTLLLNLMLEEAVTRKDFNSLRQIVECFKEHRISINHATLNQVIRYFRDFDNAMSFLFRYIKVPRYPFDESNYEKLFLLAFKHQSYNACRVLWRYACMRGATTGKMRHIVKTSLTGHVPGSRTNPGFEAWRTSVGKVAVGLEYYQAAVKPPRALQAMVPHVYADNPVLYLLKSERLDENQLAVAKALVHRDVEAGKRLRPVEPLELMLDAALMLDREWRNVSKSSWSTLDILKNAIHVPVQKRRRKPVPFSRYPLIPD